ncbi:Choline/ethanolaminephosphotransferase [Entamoeba marina]
MFNIGNLFISQNGKKNLHNYSFNGIDYSFCANNILAPYIWEPLLKHYIPLSLAPNILTTIGFISMSFVWILLFFLCPTVTDDIPIYLLFVINCGIFIYQIADNVDGRQARRTNNATPLGELFDHGNDSLMIGIFALIVVMALHTSITISLITLIILYIIFFLSHWEEYHTGTLILDALLNPTELQLLVMGLLFVEMVYPSILSLTIIGIQLKYLIVIGVFVGGFGALLMYFYKVFAFLKKSNQCTFLDALKRLLPFAEYIILTSILFICCPSSILSEQFQSIVAITIIINAFITQRIILNRICGEEVDQFYWINVIFACYVFGMIISSFGYFPINSLNLTYLMLLISIAQETTF